MMKCLFVSLSREMIPGWFSFSLGLSGRRLALAYLVIMMMYMVIIMMKVETIKTTGLHLIALMGKNLPVLFSSVLISKKGLLQMKR